MKKKIKGFMLVLLLLGSTFLNNLIGYANFEGYKNNCVTEVPTDNSKGKNSIASDDSSEGGSWEAEGTRAHQIAQNMWNYWKEKGFSGSAIAGVMGNVAHEGGFDIPDRAEGHYGGTSKENGISEGNAPSVGSGYPIGKSGQAEGGAGHYQITPYSKFAPIGDAKWKSTEKQSDFVWSSEVGKASWLDEYIHLDSVETAVEMWFSKYERGASLNSAKISSGKKAYQIFGGANIKGNSTLANAVSNATKGEEKAEEKGNKKTNYCYSSDNKDGNSGNGNTIKSEKAIEILENTLGDTINNGECYGLTAFYVEKLGGPKMMGSGKMNAWAIGSDYDWESHGWKVIKNPKPSDLKAGDVINWQAGGKIAISSYGHTGIIKSVDSDNTFKSYEQNAEKGRVSAEYTRAYEDNVITSLVRKVK